MPAVTTVREVLYRASTLLGDIKPQFRRWSEIELVSWFNDGQRAIAKYIPYASSRIDAIKLNPGSRQSISLILATNVIPGDGAPAANLYGVALIDIIRNLGTDGLTPGAAIRPIPREVQDNINSLWHAVEGDGEIDHYMYDPRMPKDFYVVPAISASVPTWVEVSYMAKPTEIAAPAIGDTKYGYADGDTTKISLDDVYVDDLVNYVVARGFLKDAETAGNMAKFQVYTQLFINSINAQVQTITGTNPNLSFLPFAPAPAAAAR